MLIDVDGRRVEYTNCFTHSGQIDVSSDTSPISIRVMSLLISTLIRLQSLTVLYLKRSLCRRSLTMAAARNELIFPEHEEQ